ncbi:hypothetical protein RB195_002265 [Necator americanus]|uniref:Uncharacterized protein n=1 Tax=Necator americanus TaxID=51031 RepID=A0ABR1DJL4_NECAM
MSDVSNPFSAWETLPEDEPPLCIAVRRPVSPPRHYEAVNRCGGDGGYDNEIDHIIINKGFSLTDVAVVPKFYTGSDHRLLRGRFPSTRTEEKAAKFSKRTPRTIIDRMLFASLVDF